ncbi:MAG: methyl-accepting chemotaxis protein [Nitrospiria bacterium]
MSGGIKKVTSNLSLGRKILISIILLMSVSIAATVLMVNSSIEAEAEEDLLLNLKQAQTIFMSFLSTQGEESALKNRLLTKISFVRALVMGKDPAAIGQFAQDTLKNTKSDLVMFTDGEGRTLSRTDKKEHGEDLSGFSSVSKAMQGKKGFGLLIEGSEVYQINSLPIKAGPTIQGTISLGNKIDDQYVRKITEMTKSKISFISRGTVIASVWGMEERDDLRKMLSNLNGFIQETIKKRTASPPFNIKIGSETFTSVLLPIQEETQESAGIYLIQISRDKAMLVRDNIQRLMLIIGVISLLIAIVVSIVIAKQISNPISVLVGVSKAISKGDLSVSSAVDHLVQERGDEVGILAKSFSEMISGLKKEEARNIKMAQISAMVENSTSNIVFADTNLNITYMNAASTQTLKNIQHLLPIPVDKIVGSSIKTIFKNPERIRNILSNPDCLPHTEKIILGTEHLNLTAMPIYDINRNRIGTMANWSIVTSEVELRKTLSKTAASLATSSEQLFLSSQEMTVNSKETSDQAQRVSSASEETNQNVQSVSAATKEMSTTIQEISKSVQETSQITSSAVEMADNTTEAILKLGDSSSEIGKVIKVINSIAQQTNLLALNATIEAARAGEAGKGFAVVANEVKELAKGTGKATEEISKQILTIQSDTKNAVGAIEEIASVIEKINEISLSVSGAIEEQSATTTEITRNIAEAAQGTDEIVVNIQGISDASVSTTEGVNRVFESSQGLSSLAKELKTALKSLDV